MGVILYPELSVAIDHVWRYCLVLSKTGHCSPALYHSAEQKRAEISRVVAHLHTPRAAHFILCRATLGAQ